MRRWILCLITLAACGVDDADTQLGDGGQANAPDGRPGDPTMDAGTDAGRTDLPVQFLIQFDYRFDTSGFFDDAGRRATLEEAGKSWGRTFADDFPSIPAG